VSVAGQVAQSGLSAAMVGMSAVKRAGEGQTTEDVSVTHAVCIVQLDATLPLWTEMEVPEARRVEGDMSAVTPGVMAMGPRSVSTSSTSAVTREVIPVERPQREGSPARGAGAEPPWTLIRIGTDMPWLEWADP
jgi:hypothetical protein